MENLALAPSAEGVVLRAKNPGRHASFLYRAASPYILSDAQARAAYVATRRGVLKASISFDEGKSWTEHSVRLQQVLNRNRHTGEGSEELWNYCRAHFIEPNVEKGKIIKDM